MLGRMRCLHDLGNWDQLSKLAAEVWVIKDSVSIRTEIASLALSAALNVLRFDLMDRFIDGLPEHTLDGSFYRALISVHKDRFSESKKFIMQSRELAATELTALIGFVVLPIKLNWVMVFSLVLISVL
jgi:FKBP12-rapamycin complex-associated protein